MLSYYLSLIRDTICRKFLNVSQLDEDYIHRLNLFYIVVTGDPIHNPTVNQVIMWSKCLHNSLTNIILIFTAYIYIRLQYNCPEISNTIIGNCYVT